MSIRMNRRLILPTRSTPSSQKEQVSTKACSDGSQSPQDLFQIQPSGTMGWWRKHDNMLVTTTSPPLTNLEVGFRVRKEKEENNQPNCVPLNSLEYVSVVHCSENWHLGQVYSRALWEIIFFIFILYLYSLYPVFYLYHLSCILCMLQLAQI